MDQQLHVVFGTGPLELGPLAEPWTAQLRGGQALEAADPLVGLDVGEVLRTGGREILQQTRWIWPLGPGQRQIVEALALRGSAP